MIDFYEDKHAVSQLHQFRSRKSKRTGENASSILTTLHISGRPEQSKAHLLTNIDFNKSFNSTCEKKIYIL